MKRIAGSLLALSLLPAACTCEPAAPAGPAAPAEPPAADAPAIPELSEEDQRLIAADPKTLSPEDARKRAFALRRKIMQNPDSPAARTLEDLRRAQEAGQLAPPGAAKVRFEARPKDGVSADAPPPGAMPPAGYRPPAADAAADGAPSPP